jgi:hypothetical protein
MSKATICDKCNKILKCSPSVKICIDFHYNGTADYELCEECKQKLIKWLGEEETKKANSDYARDWRY